jgi:acyl-CoA thioester hydrolase
MNERRAGPSRRNEYRAFHSLTTRWADNDALGHVNNASYYFYYDAAVTAWLIGRGYLGFTTGPMWMVVETGSRFHSEVSFPDLLAVGMRVARIGTSSVRWELAVFREGAEQASAEGHFVHVHVARESRRPAPLTEPMRAALSA